MDRSDSRDRRTRMVLPDLSPQQVVEVYDALLANADRLSRDAERLIEDGSVALARSLVILALEESGKAVAIHERRISIAFDEEGTPFADDPFQGLWRDHKLKLQAVHDFLVREDYWFATEPPERHELLLGPWEVYVNTLKHWANDDNLLKQRGFYVDVDDKGSILEPNAADIDDVHRMLEMVHQVGWQIRLGDHIRAKDSQSDHFSGATRNNEAFLLKPTGANPFEYLGKPGHEAETRELMAVMAETQSNDGDPPRSQRG